jgi:uncharacterized membrane protein YbhN (UPF0104 family)
MVNLRSLKNYLDRVAISVRRQWKPNGPDENERLANGGGFDLWRRLYRLRQILYWAIPVIIIYIIFQQIDLAAFKLNIAKANPWLVALGIGFYPVVILAGALRWRLFMTQFHQGNIPLGFALKHYWISLALGRFMPASIGMDVYRVIVSGRHFGKHSLNITVIIIEKLMSLLSCLILIIILLPLVPIDSTRGIEQVLYWVYGLFFSFAILWLLITIMAARRGQAQPSLLGRLETYSLTLLKRFADGFRLRAKIGEPDILLKAVIEPLTRPGQLLPMLLASVSIQLVMAVGNQIFFQALGYDLPFVVNLFVGPIMFLLFVLPISFGSLGIRESAYILLYGLFNVPPEIALIVNFFNLSGILLNNLLGGLLMMISGSGGEVSSERGSIGEI